MVVKGGNFYLVPQCIGISPSAVSAASISCAQMMARFVLFVHQYSWWLYTRI